VACPIFKKTLKMASSPLGVKIYVVKNFEIIFTYSHTNIRPDPTFEIPKKDFFSLALLRYCIGQFFNVFGEI
jgi:hypothetical protein